MQRGPAQRKHICFMSPKCQWSIAFLKELEKTPYLNEFNIVDVKTLTKEQIKSFGVTKVPTLVISDPNDPEPMKTDGEVMNWLSLRRLRESNSMPRVPPAPGVSTPSAVQSSMPGEPEPFVMGEMGSNGQDPYSFIDQDTSTNGNGGMRIMHSYEFLGGQPMMTGGGPQQQQQTGMGGGAGNGQKKSKREELFDKEMERYQRERDSGMPQVRPRQ